MIRSIVAYVVRYAVINLSYVGQPSQIYSVSSSSLPRTSVALMASCPDNKRLQSLFSDYF